jgi:hypothetical protein
MFRLVRFFPFMVILCLGVPALINSCGLRIGGRTLAFTTAIVVITLPFCYFPSFYAQNGNPPARSLIVPGAALVGYLMFVGLAVRPLLAQHLTVVPSAVALAALALVPVAVAATTFPEQASAAEYAALFDAEDRQIRASRDGGQADLLVPPLPPNFGENFVGSNSQDWFNMCVARYYGVRSIAASPS